LRKEASTRIERVPARYTTESETIEVKPASTKWVKKKADRNCLSADPNDCLVWCLVEVPAEFKTVTKQIRQGCAAGYTDSGDDCIKTIEIPAEYGTATKRIVKTPATTRQEAIPAEYSTVTKRVIKTPATTREEMIPAQYSTVTKQVIKTPATTRTETIPAEYSTVTKRVIKNAATTREEAIPAQYKTITKTVLKTPATTREEVIPAEYSTVTKRVLKNAASQEVQAIPAEYATQTRQVLKTAASTTSVEIPAEYATVTKRRLVKPGGMTEWREVICNNQVTDYTYRQIQDALRSRGYNPGPSDNVFGAQTKAALTKFQKENGLPVGQLDFGTLKALGIKY